jgi:hypothetical protein
MPELQGVKVRGSASGVAEELRYLTLTPSGLKL